MKRGGFALRIRPKELNQLCHFDVAMMMVAAVRVLLVEYLYSDVGELRFESFPPVMVFLNDLIGRQSHGRPRTAVGVRRHDDGVRLFETYHGLDLEHQRVGVDRNVELKMLCIERGRKNASRFTNLMNTVLPKFFRAATATIRAPDVQDIPLI